MAAAGDGVSLSVQVDDKITGELKKLAKNLADVDPALDEIGASLVTSTQQRFEEEKAPDGAPWRALAPGTIARRGPDAKILRDRAELYDSLTHIVSTGAQVEVGSNKAYARVHQLGGQTGRGHKVKIWARPYLGVSDDDAKEIEHIVKDHLAVGDGT